MSESTRLEGSVPEDPRVRFAAERTMLAWIRTGLAFMGFGFVVARFGVFLHEFERAGSRPVDRGPAASLWFGVALVLLGVGLTFLGAREHLRVLRRLKAGQPLAAPSWSLGLIAAAGLILLGMAMAAYLIYEL